MKQTNTRAMVETAFVSTIVVMLTIVGSTVPFLSLLATLVAPSGIALIGIRWADIAVPHQQWHSFLSPF